MHYTQVDDKPDTVVIHVGTNDFLKHANHIDITNNIIQIGLRCRTYGVNEILISSIVLKNNARLNAIIRRFHDMVQKFWMKNNFHFVEMMSLPQIIRVKMVCIYRSYNESDFSDELSASLSLILKT